MSVNNFPTDERRITDEDFFAVLNFAVPGMKGVERAVKDKRPEAARVALVKHFRTRTKPHWLFEARGASCKAGEKPTGTIRIQGRAITAEETIVHADKMLENIMLDSKDLELDLGPGMERLLELHAGGRPPSPLSRMGFLTCLATARMVTGEQAYLDKYVEFLDKFLRECPFAWNPDDSMNAAWGALAWIGLLHTDVPYEEGVPPELTFQLIRSLWFRARQFRNFDDDPYVPYNHHLFERGISPFIFALMLPEFQDMKPMFQRGRRVIREHLQRDFYEDGGYSEHSIWYSTGAVLEEMMIKPFDLAKRNNTYVVRGKLRERFIRSYAMRGSMVMPDGNLPDFGDSGGLFAKDLLETGKQFFGCATSAAILDALGLSKDKTANKKALPPKSIFYDKAGYLVARDGWKSDSNYMVMSTNVLGLICHAHHDMLSLNIAARGEAMIGEPDARVGYEMGSLGRGWHYNMTSHNTVLAYSEPIRDDILFSVNYGCFPPAVKVCKYQADDEHMFVVAGHDGYTSNRHQREILFVHNYGWLLLDSVFKGPRIETPHCQRWHFYKDVTIEKIDSHAFVARKGKARLLCVWPDDLTGVEIRKNRMLNEGATKKEKNLPWMADVFFKPRTQCPCLFAAVERKPSLSLVRKIREQVLRPLHERELLVPDADMNRIKAALRKKS